MRNWIMLTTVATSTPRSSSSLSPRARAGVRVFSGVVFTQLFLALTTAPLLLTIPAAAQPQPTILDDKSTTDQILDALHARGQGLKDFSGDVSIV
ncbi:MAG: hypothetical protein ABSH20_31520, partial [Tepidisphaeraceae bacterium]